MERNTLPTVDVAYDDVSEIDRNIATALVMVATQFSEGLYAGRRFPGQGPSIIIPMPTVDSVKVVAAELGIAIDVRIHRGDVHTVAKWTRGSVDVQIAHIQAPLEDFS